MKAILLLGFTFVVAVSSKFYACGGQVNDSLFTNYTYVLNAINVTGQAPFQYNWTVTDGNGMPIPYTSNAAGDSITIAPQQVIDAYGCIVYNLCITDALSCVTCLPDTSLLQIPFPCYSAFNTSIVGPNQVSVTAMNNIPPFLIVQQFLSWTDGNGSGQAIPYMGPGTQIAYTPGPQNTTTKFLLCLNSMLSTGGCLSCDSVEYTTLGLKEVDFGLQLYPNPASEVLQVKTTLDLERISVITIDGALVKQITNVQADGTSISVADLPKGLYVLELNATNGSQTKELFTKE